jgi:hypothetical protein
VTHLGYLLPNFELISIISQESSNERLCNIMKKEWRKEKTQDICGSID